MIKFFRHIRKNVLMENKNSKYIKYALGEIILVVIGILIALQINNWNEDKKDQLKVKSYLKNLVDDLNQDISETKFRISRIKYEAIFIDSIAAYFRHKKIEDLDNLEAFSKSFDYFGYRPFQWYKNTIDELKNSGSMKSIKNDSIRLMINEYYALTDHLDQDYKEDHEISEALNNQFFKIINTNYPRRRDLIDTLFLSYRENDKTIYTNSEVYKTALNTNLKLLTNDITDIHVFINQVLNHQGALNIRYKSEFPKLIEKGETIIRLIEEEYND